MNLLANSGDNILTAVQWFMAVVVILLFYIAVQMGQSKKPSQKNQD